MLKHIGITIKDETEVKSFYQDVLGMKIVRQFTVDSALSLQIFEIDRATDVYLLQSEDLFFELFIHDNVTPKNYNHICISSKFRNRLVEKAKNNKYTCIIIKKNNYDLVFIKDGSGNTIEVKNK